MLKKEKKKKSIFWCSRKRTDPKIDLTRTEIKIKYIEQENLSIIKFSEPDFSENKTDGKMFQIKNTAAVIWHLNNKTFW